MSSGPDRRADREPTVEEYHRAHMAYLREEVRSLSGRIEKLSERIERLSDEREGRIRTALRIGLTPTELAEDAGLSVEQIYQIIERIYQVRDERR